MKARCNCTVKNAMLKKISHLKFRKSLINHL